MSLLPSALVVLTAFFMRSPLDTTMKQIVLKTEQLIGCRIRAAGEVVEVYDNRAKRLVDRGDAEFYLEPEDVQEVYSEED